MAATVSLALAETVLVTDQFQAENATGTAFDFYTATILTAGSKMNALGEFSMALGIVGTMLMLLTGGSQYLKRYWRDVA